MTPLEIMECLAATWAPDAMGDQATARSWAELFSPDITLTEPPSLPHGGVACPARGVWTEPGTTTLARMPRGPYAAAISWVSEIMPPLAAE